MISSENEFVPIQVLMNFFTPKNQHGYVNLERVQDANTIDPSSSTWEMTVSTP